MLHILFLILKIIGIILAIILGILVLLLCILFFVPFCYQGSAKCDGKIESLCGIFKVTWLFKLIQVSAKYENGNFKYSVQIAWKKILGGKTNEKTKDISKQEETSEPITHEPVKNQKIQKMVKEPEESVQSIPKETSEESFIHERSEKAVTATEEKLSFTQKIKRKFSTVKEKLQTLQDKIKCTIKNIYDKLNMLLEKKEQVMQFIKDPNHIKAFLKIKKELFKLLRRIKPKKFIVKARFGFEDPALTGKILAVLCMIYPFTEDHMELIPDFEKQVLDGRVTIKGKLHIIHFIRMIWNLVWCKHIRILYKDVRNFKL